MSTEIPMRFDRATLREMKKDGWAIRGDNYIRYGDVESLSKLHEEMANDRKI